MLNDTEKVLISREQLAALTESIGKRISEDYKDKNPLMVCILKGSSVFFADLLREMTIPCRMDFIQASSYGDGTESSGSVKIIKNLDTNIKDRDVIIVEDIIDSGVTLSRLVAELGKREPKSLELCTLLIKPARRKAHVDVKYKGCDIPDEFVVGYGLDYAEKYRNLKDVCILKPEIYAK